MGHEGKTSRDPGSTPSAVAAGREDGSLDAPVGPLASPSRVEGVLGLQRAVGDQAVAQALLAQDTQSGPAKRVLQRYTGREHESLGDATRDVVDLGNGVVLTWGQLVAIAGDEYGSLDELLEDAKTPVGQARIRAALEHGGVPGTVAATLPAPTAAQESAQTARYVALAFENIEHFAAGGRAVETWATHHARALEQALHAGLAGDRSGFELSKATEAFGQHFLTDAFSGGHVRTPRAEIIAFYVPFAHRVVDTFIWHLEHEIFEGLLEQISPQTDIPDILIEGDVSAAAQREVGARIATMGGRDAFAGWLGLALAGAVSGTIHDEEGERGVLVSSEAHPLPWRAYGDAKLDFRPGLPDAFDTGDSREQAELAVLTAHQDVERAFMIGEAERETHTRSEAPVPQTVYFGFDSSELEPEAADAAATAAAHMLYHPDAHVELVGHADPIGKEDSNEKLGDERADAVEASLLRSGVEQARVTSRSEGERTLVSKAPSSYRLNRRVEFIWTSRTNRDPSPPDPAVSDPQADANGADTDVSVDPALERARQRLAAEIPAPYEHVQRYVPRAVEPMNRPLPEWRWGSMSPEFRDSVDTYVRGMIGGYVAPMLADTALDDRTEQGFLVRPRPIVQGIIDDLLARPTEFVGELIHEEAGP